MAGLQFDLIADATSAAAWYKFLRVEQLVEPNKSVLKKSFDPMFSDRMAELTG
jgi:hypothetical protein